MKQKTSGESADRTGKVWLAGWLAVLIALSGSWAAAEGLAPISLPAPPTGGGRPLMEALRQRRTVRDFKPDKLSLPALGNLLWAAFGVNRPETGGRTAPSAMNSQEVDLYVALPEGLYVYEPRAHRLEPVLSGDVRGKTGAQAFATNAPVTLLFVADLSRLSKARPESRVFYADVDTGYISQNVYLYCASEGLATVVHDLDRAPLLKILHLRPEQRIILAQAIGYPKD